MLERPVLERREAVLELLDGLAPTSAEVTRGSRSTQASAIWARVWPRRWAIPLRARTLARFTSLSRPC